MTPTRDELALLRETYFAEAAELLAALEDGVVALERRGVDPAQVQELFRAAHTFKGNAAGMGFEKVAALAHQLEELLDQLRAGRTTADAAVVAALLAGVDGLKHQVAADLAGEPEDQPAPRLFADATAGGEVNGVDRTRTLRVGIDKLDRLLDLSGEIAIARGRLIELVRVGAGHGSLLEILAQADGLYAELQQRVMQARMVPLAPTFTGLQRVVRDAAQACGKSVRLTADPGDVEVDTRVIEHMREALTHMLRNAIDHGLETAAEREAAGKPATGTLALRARHESGNVEIELHDDGRGLDRARIRERAVAHGLVDPAALPAEHVLDALIFEPGFSTAREVSALSGRGVGLDVVRRNVESLRGRVSVTSEPGAGCTFAVRLPVTLAIIDGFVVGVGPETYVLPLDDVIECLELPAATARGESRGVLELRGQALPYVRLRARFGVPGAAARREQVVVVRRGRGWAGLVVDELRGEAQTVVRPLAGVLAGLPGVFASAIQGDGRVALILDVPGLWSSMDGEATAA